MTAVVEQPYGYGRIIRTAGKIVGIVEERDASPVQRRGCEINSGIYAFDLPPLFDALRTIAARNAQGEYYLTDLVAAYRRRRLPVETLIVGDPREVRGVNTRGELSEVSTIMRQNKNAELMAAGVTIVDPATTYIDDDVEIGPDTVIHPGVLIQGRSKIGSACEIHANVRIADSDIGDRVTVNNFCLILDSQVADGAAVGPFAHLRSATQIGQKAKIGNFVELKKTTFGCWVESRPFVVPRRCDGRQQRQRRCGYHHVQLRRPEEAPDGDRRRRLYRKWFAAHRAGPSRQGEPTSERARPSPRMSRRGLLVSAEAGKPTLRAGRTARRLHGRRRNARQAKTRNTPNVWNYRVHRGPSLSCRSCWMGCGAWSIAATTPQASRW